MSDTHPLRAVKAALEKLAAIADTREFDPLSCSDERPIYLGVMNGNVSQSIIRDQLTAKDFRNAKQALTQLDTLMATHAIVPLEPDIKMIDAGNRDRGNTVGSIYKAMLAASPAAGERGES